MSVGDDLQALARPLRVDQPCGEDLQVTDTLASFDAFRVFGQLIPPPKPPDWRVIHTQAWSALGRSKDLRILAFWAAASLRLDGWQGFLGSIDAASQWLVTYWDGVYPLLEDGDAILRRNAIGYFSDQFAVIDAVRRRPLVAHRALGSFGLRDLELAQGKRTASSDEKTPATMAAITDAFAATPAEEIEQLGKWFTSALKSLNDIDQKMRSVGGSGASPPTEKLIEQLKAANGLIAAQLALRAKSAAPAGTDSTGAATHAPGAGVAKQFTPGAITSRHDAAQVLDLVARYFKEHEPSSPVPLFIDRARRLIGRNFLEALGDVLPESVAKVSGVVGVAAGPAPKDPAGGK